MSGDVAATMRVVPKPYTQPRSCARAGAFCAHSCCAARAGDATQAAAVLDGAPEPERRACRPRARHRAFRPERHGGRAVRVLAQSRCARADCSAPGWRRRRRTTCWRAGCCFSATGCARSRTACTWRCTRRASQTRRDAGGLGGRAHLAPLADNVFALRACACACAAVPLHPRRFGRGQACLVQGAREPALRHGALHPGLQALRLRVSHLRRVPGGQVPGPRHAADARRCAPRALTPSCSRAPKHSL